MSAIMNLEDEEPLLMTGQASRILEISPERLRHIGNEGKMPFTKTANGQRLYKRTDVEAYRLQRQSQPYRFGRPLKGGKKPK